MCHRRSELASDTSWLEEEEEKTNISFIVREEMSFLGNNPAGLHGSASVTGCLISDGAFFENRLALVRSEHPDDKDTPT